MQTKSKESATRKKIDLWLNNLGWITDEELPECNVFTERFKTKVQQEKLKGQEPDYTLYASGTDRIIGIIDAKRKGVDLKVALLETVEKYAAPLDVPLIFVTDGTFIRSWHLSQKRELKIDGEVVSELPSEKILLRFIHEGAEITLESKKIKYSREQLMEVFKWANDILRKEGIREGFDRFIEFANLLFLKLISEMENEREANGEERVLAKKYCWETFASMPSEPMLEYINGTVLPHLVDTYNHSGDVFQTKLQISTSKVLKDIVERLSRLSLIDSDSDVKGDAFEYFLKNSVTVGNDLGEYFTPRHIVKLMVNLTNPQFGEKVYDPTCGTGGFLIQAFNHVRKTCKHTPENLKILKEHTIYGRELTNTARISKMNMIITGDGHTNIEQTDSLKNPVKNKYDVVLANPPYGQTTDWGDLYPVPSVQADSVFIQHIMRSLNSNGRAAVIVPEGFLFRPGPDARTRKLLLTDFNIVAVISLPQGVFNPYTDSKTNILVFQKEGKPTKSIWFYNLKNDGYGLGKTRKPIEDNDIPDLIDKWEGRIDSENSWNVDISTIAKNGYDIRVDAYSPRKSEIGEIPVAKFSELLERRAESIEIKPTLYKLVRVKWYGEGAELRSEVHGSELKTKRWNIVHKGDFVISKIDARKGAMAIVPEGLDQGIVSNDFPVFRVRNDKVLPEYFEYLITLGRYSEILAKESKGTTNRIRAPIDAILNLQAPIPSIGAQTELVERLNAQREIMESIDKALNLIEIERHSQEIFKGDWRWTPLSEVADVEMGLSPPSHSYNDGKTGMQFLQGPADFSARHRRYTSMPSKVGRKNDIIIAVRATIGDVWRLDEEWCIGRGFAIIRAKAINNSFLFYFLNTQKDALRQEGRGSTFKSITKEHLARIKVPMPPSNVQDMIVQRLKLQDDALSALKVLKDETKKRMEDMVHSLFIGQVPVSKDSLDAWV